MTPPLRSAGDAAPELVRLVSETMERHGLKPETALAILEIVQQGRLDEQLARIQNLLEAEAREDLA